MQQGDYTSTTPYYPNYPQNPNPNPPITSDLHHQPSLPYASAPPFATTTSYHAPPPPPTQSDYYPTAPSSYTPNPNPHFDPSHTPYQSQPPPFIPNSPYDHLNMAPSYTPPPPQNPIPVNHSSSFQYSPSLYNNNPVSPVPVPAPVYDSSYDTNYSGNYGRSVSDLEGGDYYGKRQDMGVANRYESSGGGGGGGYGEGVYAYQGGTVEPYGSRGTGSKSSTWKEQVMFDDFGRPIGLPGGNKDSK